MEFKWAPTAYKLLRGICCIYKPSGLPVHKVVETIQYNLCRDLNALPCYKYEQKQVEPDPYTKVPVHTSVPGKVTSLIDNRLVLGQRYIQSDVDIRFLDGMSRHSSGVLLFSINYHGHLQSISSARYIRVYHVQGSFGIATENFTPGGSVLDRSTYYHITKVMMDKILAAAQSSHQKKIFEYAGVDPQSQTAYELASKGVVRPATRKTPPVIYGVKCIDLNLPDFTLEIHSINDTSVFLQSFIHELGLKLKSTAVCTQVRRIRYGHFTLDHALLKKHWTLQHIIENIEMCKKLVAHDVLSTSPNLDVVKQQSVPTLTDGGTRLLGTPNGLEERQVLNSEISKNNKENSLKSIETKLKNREKSLKNRERSLKNFKNNVQKSEIENVSKNEQMDCSKERSAEIATS